MNRISNPLFHLFVNTLGRPAFPTPPGKTETDLLAEKVRAGLAERWPQIQTHHPKSVPSVYQDRLDRELAVIDDQEASAFFLIIADFIEYACQNSIYGPSARGAVHGSLVCFCLGLTDVDPVAHGLLFERFFNYRSSPIPRIDLDIYDYDSHLSWHNFFASRNRALMVETLDLIEMKGLAVPDLSRIDFADKATAQLLATGDSAGVYCLESADMQKLLPQVPPQSLTDVAILQALAFIMPDPSENSRLRDYIERKQGRRETRAAFAELDPFLEDTRGLIIYQEQIMRIAQIMAGYTLEESDRFWIAMGQKIHAKIEHHRQQFIQGAVSNGVDTATARQIYEHLVDFGGYAHNKAHGIACALSTWQSAYLKAHFPVEFAAALTKSTSMSME